MEDLPKSLAQHVFIRHPPNGRGFKPNLRPFQAPGKLGPPTGPLPARRLTATLKAASIGFPFEIEDCWTPTVTLIENMHRSLVEHKASHTAARMIGGEGSKWAGIGDLDSMIVGG